jgi:hypothetical protein
MKRIKRIATFILLLTMVGCGSVSRDCATWTGNDKVCIDGVQYIQFTSGVSVAYNQDGTVKVCGESK